MRFVLLLMLFGTAVQTSLNQAAAQSNSSPRELATREQDSLDSLRFLGLSSCAASNCHGGGRRIEGIAYSAYLHWWQKDLSHRRAFQVLRSELSKSIVEQLNAGSDTPTIPAHQDRKCLVCHATGVSTAESLRDTPFVRTQNPFDSPSSSPSALNSERFARQFQLSDGVQCEACHGPAEEWIHAHTTDAWLNPRNPGHWSIDQKRATGYRPLEDLAERAMVCGSCHVGSTGRDMNHDMIAAGHPRLDFEFATFHERLPDHWDRNRDAIRSTGMDTGSNQAELASQFEAQAWLYGQLSSAMRSLELLEYRARDLNRSWPEFSEYGCYSCHHSLTSPSWRQQRGSSGRYPWGDWYFTMLPVAGHLGSDSARDLSQQKRDALQSVMAAPYPDRMRTRRSVRELRQALEILESELRQQVGEPGRPRPVSDQRLVLMLKSAVEQTSHIERQSWDSAAQLYLSLVALRGSVSTASNQNVDQREFDLRLEAVRQTLLFDRGPDLQPSPRMVNSPAQWKLPMGSETSTDGMADLRVWAGLREGLSDDD